MASWGVFDEEDHIEFVEAAGGNGNQVYENLSRLCDEQISKLILGQTLTADGGASLAQAKIHENIANDIVRADLAFVETLVNEQLMPLLKAHSLIADGVRFHFDYRPSLSLNEQMALDIQLLNHYSIPASYFRTKYGVEVEDNA